MNGHDLAKELIHKHGKDRYPTIEAVLLKLVEEIGELVQQFNKRDPEAGIDINKFAKEYADVGLTLYELGNKLYLNLEDEMLTVVNNDNRKYA